MIDTTDIRVDDVVRFRPTMKKLRVTVSVKKVIHHGVLLANRAYVEDGVPCLRGLANIYFIPSDVAQVELIHRREDA